MQQVVVLEGWFHSFFFVILFDADIAQICRPLCITLSALHVYHINTFITLNSIAFSQRCITFINRKMNLTF